MCHERVRSKCLDTCNYSYTDVARSGRTIIFLIHSRSLFYLAPWAPQMKGSRRGRSQNWILVHYLTVVKSGMYTCTERFLLHLQETVDQDLAPVWPKLRVCYPHNKQWGTRRYTCPLYPTPVNDDVFGLYSYQTPARLRCSDWSCQQPTLTLTLSGFSSRCGTFISVCDQPPRSTQPGHPFVGRRSEYKPKSGDALLLGSKGRYGSCVGGR